jgi:crotonobetainyl-CoA:carnitine CoA-transferase CaiB-like acyl-CoA transferase
MSITGDPEREPLKCYGRLGEYQAGVHAAVAIVAALLARDVNGQGEAADVSIAESMTFLMGGPPLLAQMLGLVLRRNGTRLIGMGERHPYPSTLRPCRDGWVHAHVNYRYPELLAALVGDPWLASDEVLGAMSAHADEIDRRLDRWLANKSKWEAVEQAQSMRLPFTEVLDPAEVLEDRHGHHRSRHNFLTLRTRRLGDIKVVASPIKFGPRPEQVEPPPQLGEHNEEVFGGWLGLTDRELATLRQAGVI